MAQNRLYRHLSSARSGSRLRDSVGQSQLVGLACVLIGASQLPLAFLVSEQSLVLFIMGSGGWLLISMGINLFLGNEAFESRWDSNERTAWLGAVCILLVGLFVVAATAVVLMSP